MAKKKFKSKLQSFLRFLIGPTLLSWFTWAFTRAKGGLVLFSSLFIIVGFLYISSPNRLVIDRYNNVEGIVNQLRLYAQGRRFLYNQLDQAETILHSSSGRSMALILEEVEDKMESFERSIGIIDELNQADVLRQEADRIERRETAEFIERLRQRRIEDCKIIIPQIRARLIVTGPTYTHWILLSCFVLALTFITVQLAPNTFRSILEDPDNPASSELKQDIEACLAKDLGSGTIINDLHSIQAKLIQRRTNGGIEDDTADIVIFPYFNNVYLARGLVKQLAKDYAGALDDYNMALKVGSFYSTESYYYFRGTTNYHLRNYNESLKDLDLLIKIYPTSSSAYYFRGLTKLRLYDEEGARMDFNKASQMGYRRAKKLLKLIDKKGVHLE
jgi:tetratricopeptide (TPR) repeat protein